MESKEIISIIKESLKPNLISPEIFDENNNVCFVVFEKKENGEEIKRLKITIEEYGIENS